MKPATLYSRLSSARAWLLPAVSISCCLWVSSAHAQDTEAFIHLRPSQCSFERLAPGALSAAVEFAVDEADTIFVEITATVGDLTTSIEAPGGEILDENTIGNFRGEFGTFEGSDLPDSFSILPSSSPGFHYLYTFPSLGAGTYIVHLDADPGLAEEVAVIVELTTNSPVVANIVATETTVNLGSSAVLTAMVYEGSNPVAGAAVSAWIKPPVADAFTLSLLDNGLDADTAVGDGLYSAFFQPAELGLYTVVGEITGVNSLGTPFTRASGTEILVVEAGAAFTGTPFSDHGEDDNANGLFERVVVTAEVDVNLAGLYGLYVDLETAMGVVLPGFGEAVLTPGIQSIDAAIDASIFLAADEDGPYTIKRADLVFLDGEAGIPADEFEDGTQQTQAYLLTQFERPPIILTGNNTDFAVDTDSDGDFDLLTVNVGIDVLIGGTYFYSVTLRDPCFIQIEFITGQQVLQGGSGSEELVLEFTGALIGENGIDGPYLVEDLGIFGPGGSLVSLSVAETQPYLASAFDSFNGVPADCVDDCNANGEADSCDIAIGTSADCNANACPDECDIVNFNSEDLNLNCVPDECDCFTDPRLISSHTDLDFDNFDFGDVEILFGIAEGEALAASYTISPESFPLEIRMVEMVFAQSTSVPTETHWSMLVWEGTPDTGNLVEVISSDGVSIPHLHMDAGDVATILAVNPKPGTIIVNDIGAQTFSVGIRIDQHNNQTQDPCIVNPPSDSNAFPAVDLSGVSTETGNWMYFVDCGPLGCPAGWNPFEDRFFCAPSGDLALRVFWTPAAAADCNENGVPDFCEIEDGTRLDTDGNGVPDECECPWDLDGDGEVGSFDLALLLGAWGLYGPCPPLRPEDFNQDYDVGPFDLASLLGFWGTCPINAEWNGGERGAGIRVAMGGGEGCPMLEEALQLMGYSSTEEFIAWLMTAFPDQGYWAGQVLLLILTWLGC